MQEFVDQAIIHFTEMHDQYIHDWNTAMNTGDTSALETMAEQYYVAFFYDTSNKPVIFSREESIAGMQQSVQDLLGGKQLFHNRLIRKIGEEQLLH